jgi:hypothetical protein
MTTQAGTGATLFRSAVERRFLFYLLTASAFAALVVIIGVAVPYVWAQSRQTAYMVAAAGAVDFAVTLFFAFTFRWAEVTFDGRRVRFGSSIFRTSIPVEDILSAEVIRPEAGGGALRAGGERVALTTAAGVYTAPCANAETLVELIRSYGGSES